MKNKEGVISGRFLLLQKKYSRDFLGFEHPPFADNWLAVSPSWIHHIRFLFSALDDLPELVSPDPVLAYFPLSLGVKYPQKLRDGKNMFRNIMGRDDDEAALVVAIPCQDPAQLNIFF